MPAPNTNSIIDGPNGLNTTRTNISTNIIIEVNGIPVGAIQELRVSESRNIQAIDEVGTDGHIDSVPNRSTDISGSARRIRYDRMRVAEAFNKGIIHVSAQRTPFDIVIKDTFADINRDDSGTIVTTIRNVWIREISYSFQAENFIITDDMQWQAEAIYSTLGTTSGNVIGTTTGRGDPIILNPFELEADRGDRRGALDERGLIEAFNEVV